MKSIQEMRDRLIEANDYDPAPPPDKDNLPLFLSFIDERPNTKRPPKPLLDLIDQINGEIFFPMVWPMARQLMRPSPTYDDEFVGDWVRLMDGATLYSFDGILSELDRIDFYPPPEFEPHWIPVGDSNGSYVVVDGERLGVWNCKPYDDEPPEYMRWIHDDVGALVNDLLAAVVAGRFELRPYEFGLDLVFEGTLMYGEFEWLPAEDPAS